MGKDGCLRATHTAPRHLARRVAHEMGVAVGPRRNHRTVRVHLLNCSLSWGRLTEFLERAAIEDANGKRVSIALVQEHGKQPPWYADSAASLGAARTGWLAGWLAGVCVCTYMCLHVCRGPLT